MFIPHFSLNFISPCKIKLKSLRSWKKNKKKTNKDYGPRHSELSARWFCPLFDARASGSVRWKKKEKKKFCSVFVCSSFTSFARRINYRYVPTYLTTSKNTHDRSPYLRAHARTHIHARPRARMYRKVSLLFISHASDPRIFSVSSDKNYERWTKRTTIIKQCILFTNIARPINNDNSGRK